jgi:hypothetical protein
MSIDIYSPRVMIPLLREIKPVRTFLRDTFFAQARTYRVENIDIDTQEKGRRVAPFVNRWAPGKFVERLGFATSSVAPPCIAMKTSIVAQDISTRSMGEHVYENRDPGTRAQALLADDLADLQEMLTRREEMMCRDAIFNLVGNNSVVTAVGEDSSLTFAFARKAALNLAQLAGIAAWTDAASDPLAQIDTWLEIYARETGLVATDLIFGGTAYRTFLDNAKVKAKMVNTSLIQTGVVAPNNVPDGARFVGSLYGGALKMWTYHEWYDDPDNAATTTAMVPDKKVMIASSRLRTERRYGAVQDLTNDGPDGMPTLVEAVALPRSWVEKDPPARFLELRSRPLPVPIQNHFLTVQVQA